MGRLFRQILAVSFFLALAFGVGFIYFRMFLKPPVDLNSINSAQPSRINMTFSDAPRPSFLTPTPSPVTITPTPSPTPAKQKREIYVTILDFDSSRPVPNFPVNLLGFETTYYSDGTSDQDGNVVFTNIPEDAGDNFLLQTTSRNHYMAEENVAIGATLTLKPVVSATLQGQVSDADSQMPIKDADITLVVRWNNADLYFQTKPSERGDYSEQRLPPGEVVSVVVTAPSYVPEEHVSADGTVRLVRMQAVRLNLACHPGTEITGTVSTEKGNPVAGAIVFLILKGDEYLSDRASAMRDKFKYFTITDEKGRFFLPPTPRDGGEYEVVTYGEGYKLSRVKSEGKELAVVLAEGPDTYPLNPPQK